MKTLTLCESVIRAQTQPIISKSSKSLIFSSSFSSSFSLLLQKKPKLSSRNSRLCFSGYSRLWYENVTADRNLFGHSAESPSTSVHDNEVRIDDDKNGKEILKSVNFGRHHDDNCLEDSLAENSGTHENQTTKSINEDAFPMSGAKCQEGLRLALLFSFLNLQGAQQAAASTDFVGGVQSIPYIGDLGDISTGFASAFLLIFFSELGDKTFFIAALLAARNSWLVVFIGTFGALAAMTVVSVILGRTFHYVDEILPFSFGGTDLPIDDIAAVLLLVYFGVSTLVDASSGDSMKAEEEQKEAELAVSEFSRNGAGILAAAGTVISTFTLVFVAEWGDKSFFSTIALAAASSPLGVVGGALAGHAAATLLAVVGGSLLGTFFSEKVIAYTGGVLFLVFAVVTLAEIFN